MVSTGHTGIDNPLSRTGSHERDRVCVCVCVWKEVCKGKTSITTVVKPRDTTLVKWSKWTSLVISHIKPSPSQQDATRKGHFSLWKSCLRRKTHPTMKERKWSHSVMSNSLRPHGLQPTRLLRPWDFPGESTGVGCHCLLQGIFPTQEWNPGLSHWGQTLDCPSRLGSPNHEYQTNPDQETT